MNLEEIAQQGNESAVAFCQRALDSVGPGVGYKCFIGSAATNLLFHSFRIELPKGVPAAIELIQTLLDDVAHNIEMTGGQKLKFTVAQKR